MEDSLLITTRRNNPVVILDLHGKVIGSWALRLRERLQELKDTGEDRVVLNFQDVVSIDTLGVMAIQSGKELGMCIKVIHPSISCMDVINKHPSKEPIDIYYKEEDAIRGFTAVLAAPQERRRHKRIATNLPVEIEYRSHKLPGILFNLSEEGALLGYLDDIQGHLDGGPIPVPEDVRVAFNLPFLGVIELAGESVGFRKTSEMHTLGIRLFHSEKSRRVIQRLCDDPSSAFQQEA